MKLVRIAGMIIFIFSAITFAGFITYKDSTRDETVPEITFNGESIMVSVAASEEELLKDVSAFDEKDGDVTDSLLIESISKFTGKGKRIITYAAFDSDNNIVKKDRELEYTDYSPPRFSLSRPLRFNVGDMDGILRYLSCKDGLDGDLTDKIRYEDLDYFGENEGLFEIEFLATNSAGDTAYLPVEVEFYYPSYRDQANMPEILLSEYITYIKVGDTFDAKNYLQGVIIGQDEYTFEEKKYSNLKKMPKNKVTYTSNINFSESGVYSVNYSLHADNGYTGTTKLIVVVEE